MKKILSIIALSGLLGSMDALAISGGPFDNGDAGGLLLERAGFYQCTFRFNNGTGYGVFTPDAQLVGGLIGSGGGGGGAGQAAFYSAGSLYTNNSFDVQRNANRSVIYYKGVTYVGACFGMPDIESRTISGSANATSDPYLFSTQQTGTGGAGLNNTSVIVQNNTGYIANVGWTGKITRTKPTLRFTGKGTIAVLAPTGNAAITNLAFDGYRGLIGAIVQSVSNLQNANVGAGATQTLNYTNAQDAIKSVLEDLRDTVSNANAAEATFDEALTEKLSVIGTRRFY